MRPHSLRKPLSFWKRDIAASVLVVIYIGLIFLLVLAWNYLSDKADAFVSEAKEINRQELVDIIRFQPSSAHRGQSLQETFSAHPDDSTDFPADSPPGTAGHF